VLAFRSSGGNFDCTTSGQDDIWGCGKASYNGGLAFVVYDTQPE
jgi:hypothetical protein